MPSDEIERRGHSQTIPIPNLPLVLAPPPPEVEAGAPQLAMAGGRWWRGNPRFEIPTSPLRFEWEEQKPKTLLTTHRVSKTNGAYYEN